MREKAITKEFLPMQLIIHLSGLIELTYVKDEDFGPRPP